MGWSSLLVPALVLALILYVPGILVNALLFRSRVLTIAFAPLTGAAVLGAASLVSGFKPGVWGLGPSRLDRYFHSSLLAVEPAWSSGHAALPGN